MLTPLIQKRSYYANRDIYSGIFSIDGNTPLGDFQGAEVENVPS